MNDIKKRLSEYPLNDKRRKSVEKFLSLSYEEKLQKLYKEKRLYQRILFFARIFMIVLAFAWIYLIVACFQYNWKPFIFGIIFIGGLILYIFLFSIFVVFIPGKGSIQKEFGPPLFSLLIELIDLKIEDVIESEKEANR